MLYLIYKNISTLILRNRLILSLFCISQVISILSVLFMYGLVSSAQTQDRYYSESVRTFTLTPNSPLDQSIKAKLSSVENEKLTEIREIFIIMNKEHLQATFLYSPKNHVTYGHYFKQNAFIAGKNQVIASSRLTKAQKAVGDQLVILNKKYEIIGVSDTSEVHEIPFSSLENFSAIENITVVLEKIPTQKEIDTWSAYLAQKIPDCSVQTPKTQDINIRMQNASQLFAAAGVGLIAILNFSYLYRYLLTKRRHMYSILRISGCNKTKGLWLFAWENVIMSTVLFIISSLFFHFCLSRLYSFINDSLRYAVSLREFFHLYGIYLASVLFVFGFTIFRFSKQTPYKLYRGES